MQSTPEFLKDQLKRIDAEIELLTGERARTKKALDLFQGTPVAMTTSNLNAATAYYANAVASFTQPPEPTFKEKVKVALNKEFPNGATAQQILVYINSHWNRQVKRESLSPQLSRLRQEGVLTVQNNVWSLKKEPPEGGSIFD